MNLGVKEEHRVKGERRPFYSIFLQLFDCGKLGVLTGFNKEKWVGFVGMGSGLGTSFY